MQIQKKISALYAAVLACAVILIAGACLFAGSSLSSVASGYQSMDVNTDGQDADGFSVFTLAPSTLGEGDFLCFFTNHQEIYISEDGKEIYRLVPPDSVFGHTTGSVWNFVRLPQSGSGHALTIRMRPIYDDRLTRVSFYCGNGLTIYQDVLRRSFPAFSLGICIFVLGVTMLLYWQTVTRRATKYSGLGHLGVCSILLGLWVANETDAAALLIKNRLAATNAAFLFLLLLPVPFVLYIKETFHAQLDWAWKALCALSFVNLAVCLLCQFTGLADLHRTVLFTHIVLILSILYLLCVLLLRIQQGRIDRTVRFHLIGLGIMAVGILSDLFAFYSHAHITDLFGGVSFLLYTCLLAVLGASDSVLSIERGKAAEIYRQMALYDSLTDMLSRAAYDHDIAQIYQPAPTTAIVEFDLNDLKLHNDEHGHSAGDAALSQAALLIRNVFEPYGRCYRIGGDEFCTVLEHCTPQQLDSLLQMLRKSEEHLNMARHADSMPVRVACGYAFFDPSLDDTSLEDTRCRADAQMYRDKQSIKAVPGAAR
ncbi:MAG: GGDEF domain-containing protein [Faecalibacterium sp.]|jgi:diguanylate cyclase (GGDEF)-like protein|nr:GGDEF domain-containing protein [Faecalibacterium sp.]